MTYLAHGNRYTITENDQGFLIERNADLAEITFYGDDQAEKFRHAYTGDLEPLNPDTEADSADEFGDTLDWPALPPLRTWSIIINWHDDDSEQGTYGTTVRACNHHAAERMVYWEMFASYNEGEDEPDVPDDITDHYGSVVECSEGAHWKASELENALANLLDAMPSPRSRKLTEAWDHARKLIAEIRGEA